MNKDQFELAFRRWHEESGNSFDPWDLACSWKDYQKDPTKFDYLTAELGRYL